MKILFDSHALVWYTAGDRRLSRKARDIADDLQTPTVFVSAVCAWEIADQGRQSQVARSGSIVSRLQEIASACLPRSHHDRACAGGWLLVGRHAIPSTACWLRSPRLKACRCHRRPGISRLRNFGNLVRSAAFGPALVPLFRLPRPERNGVESWRRRGEARASKRRQRRTHPDRRSALLPGHCRFPARRRDESTPRSRRRGRTHHRARLARNSRGHSSLPCDAAKHKGRPYDGVVALGCVIRGDTIHFEIVSHPLPAQGLLDLSVARGLPIGNGIVTVNTLTRRRSPAPAP